MTMLLLTTPSLLHQWLAARKIVARLPVALASNSSTAVVRFGRALKASRSARKLQDTLA